MAIKYWLGGVNSNKSHKMLENVIQNAKNNPTRQYLIIVPEQFVFSTQRELVTLSDNHGILNIDVLSFMRLAHRINDEVGSFDSVTMVLDDLGKTLILQHLANENKDKLSVFGDNIDKLGYITKIKSIVSELMQYGVSPEKIDEMIALADKQKKNLLVEKLGDVNYLYKAFLAYIKDKYTTTEETLDRISSIVHNSETILNSEIIFDGFTGFTPVQLKLIGRLMEYSKGIHVALLMEEENYSNADGETELFHLSKRTISQLNRLADERHIPVDDAYKAWENEKNDCKIEKRIYAGQNPEEEILMTAAKIRQLVSSGECKYRDIAVVSADLETYRYYCERIFEKTDIPFFVDRTKPLLLNPFVEYIRAILSIYMENYSYESMFRFLKSGILSYSEEDINMLDNYCLATGVKGRKKWHSRFILQTDAVSSEELAMLDDLRSQIVQGLDKFSAEILGEKSSDENSENCRLINAATQQTVICFAKALYNRIVDDGIEERLREMSEGLKEKGEFTAAEEYVQVYRRVMDILDELVKLIPNEMVDVRTFSNLLNAGLDSLSVGIIPKSMDYVQIGDLTRSRIGNVKVLFIVGANDGIIPKVSASSGIINESERQFLTEGEDKIELAPSAREDAYTQRLYVYMAINKPSQLLYLSYARVDRAGKSQLPSYLVKQIKKENPGLKVENFTGDVSEKLIGKNIAFSEFVALLNRTVSEGISDEETYNLAKDLLRYFLKDEEYQNRTKEILAYALIKRLEQAEGNIGKAVAKALYGNVIAGSVTTLETYANCAYQYFLRNGLKLKERDIFTFEAKDMGNIFHDSLSEFSKLISKDNKDWFSITDDDIQKFMDEAVNTAVAWEHKGALYSTARTTYMVNRIKRIMKKTASVVTEQIKKGEFIPKYFEIKFEDLKDIKDLNIQLSDDEYMRLYGRVDRIDVCDKEEGIYVKIIDYKSSKKSMDLAAVYEGRQLQLLVYLNAALDKERRDTGREVFPAGVLYYHIDDPIVELKTGESDDQIREKITKQLRLTGLLNSDDNGNIAELMDKGLSETVVKVGRTKKDNALKKSKELITGDDFKILSEYVEDKVRDIGREILSGNIEIPVPDGISRFTEPNCDYCDYKAICMAKPGKEYLAGDDVTDMEDKGAESSDENEDASAGNVPVKIKKPTDKDTIVTMMKNKMGKGDEQE